MSILIPIVYLILLLFDIRTFSEGREKRVYILISVIAVTAACFAAVFAKRDHIGASLSGMISIFMR